MNELVSVIIPAKNEEGNIERCLNSLMCVDYPKDNIEIIVVDNGSLDKTVCIAKKYGAKVFVEPNLTIAGMRNLGAKNSKGDILAFVDADVSVSKDWIKNAINFLQVDSVGCVGCSPSIPVDSTWVEKVWHLHKKGKPETITPKWIASMNMFVKRDVFIEIGGFNESLKTCEDVDLGYRLSKKYKIIWSKKIKAIHYGEAKNLKHLFRKEFWRGKNNYSGFMAHGFVWQEMPSIIMPILFLVFMVIFLFSIVSFNINHIIMSLFLLFLFPVLKTMIISYKISDIRYFPHLVLVWLVYYFARSSSGADELCGIFCKKMNNRFFRTLKLNHK